MAVNNLWFHLFFFFSILVISRSDDPDCVYSFYIRTGSIWRGGTESNISATFYDSNGYGIRIRNIVTWGGLMGGDHQYFLRGALDIFSGTGQCLTAPVCALNLTSDGSGSHSGWYVNYLELTTSKIHEPCAQVLFTVEQWVASDAPPYELWAFRNLCDALALNEDGSSSKSPAILAEI